MEIGSDQRQPVTAVVAVTSSWFVIADQDHPHGLAAKRAVPETDHLGDLHGVGTPVAADPRVSPPAPHGGSGKIGRSAQAGASGAGSPGASGARRRQLMQHRGDLQPTGPGDPGLQVAQPFSDVGGVTDDMHVPIGVAGGDQLGQLAGVRDLPGLPGPPQPRQHRQAHRARQKRIRRCFPAPPYRPRWPVSWQAPKPPRRCAPHGVGAAPCARARRDPASRRPCSRRIGATPERVHRGSGRL